MPTHNFGEKVLPYKKKLIIPVSVKEFTTIKLLSFHQRIKVLANTCG
jgi:hypothetical protein